MAKQNENKIDETKTFTEGITTRPDLNVKFVGPQKPGSFIHRDGKFIPENEIKKEDENAKLKKDS